MTPRRKYLISKADKLIRQLVFEKANNRCQWCGGHADDPHHIIGRSHLMHRWRLFNILALCRRCHSEWHLIGKTEAYERLKEFPEYQFYRDEASLKSIGTVGDGQIEDVIKELERDETR